MPLGLSNSIKRLLDFKCFVVLCDIGLGPEQGQGMREVIFRQAERGLEEVL